MVYILCILLSPICLGYVEDIFQTFLNASKEELVSAVTELKDKSPPPMNVMVEKQSRVETLKKKEARSKMVVQNVPPTTPGTVLFDSKCLGIL